MHYAVGGFVGLGHIGTVVAMGWEFGGASRLLSGGASVSGSAAFDWAAKAASSGAGESGANGTGGTTAAPSASDAARLGQAAGRSARYNSALAGEELVNMDCSYIACTDAGLAPGEVAARAAGWYLVQGASAESFDHEIGMAEVVDSSGDNALRYAAKGATPNKVTYTANPGDRVVQLHHSHYHGLSRFPSNLDVRTAIRLGNVPLSTHLVGTETINVLWWDGAGTPQQAFVPALRDASLYFP